MTGAGTPSSMAASAVQRPSPESDHAESHLESPSLTGSFHEGNGSPAYVVDGETILAHHNLAGGRCAKPIHAEHIAAAEYALEDRLPHELVQRRPMSSKIRRKCPQSRRQEPREQCRPGCFAASRQHPECTDDTQHGQADDLMELIEQVAGRTITRPLHISRITLLLAVETPKALFQFRELYRFWGA